MKKKAGKLEVKKLTLNKSKITLLSQDGQRAVIGGKYFQPMKYGPLMSSADEGGDCNGNGTKK